MATLPTKPWRVEYAKSARSSCKSCKNTIDKEKLRLGKMVQSSLFDGLIPTLWKSKIEEAGGHVHAKIRKVVGGALDDQEAEMRKARRMEMPIVREDYLVDCFKRQKKLSFDLYKVEALDKASGVVTVKVKGRSAVHESSGMQGSGHILEDEKSIYNTTLNLFDLSTGVNSYYILQIIQEDRGSDCYLFRKWGRVGNDNIGGSKLEKVLKSDAIDQFKRLFLEKMGKPWEAWVSRKNFQKQPGRFYPLDIDYGVSKQVTKKTSSKQFGLNVRANLRTL